MNTFIGLKKLFPNQTNPSFSPQISRNWSGLSLEQPLNQLRYTPQANKIKQLNKCVSIPDLRKAKTCGKRVSFDCPDERREKCRVSADLCRSIHQWLKDTVNVIPEKRCTPRKRPTVKDQYSQTEESNIEVLSLDPVIETKKPKKSIFCCVLI